MCVNCFECVCVVVMNLKALDGQLEDVGRQLGRLFEGEVAPVDDEDEAVDLELRVLDQNLQREQDRPQDVCERVPERGRGESDETSGKRVCVCVCV